MSFAFVGLSVLLISVQSHWFKSSFSLFVLCLLVNPLLKVLSGTS